MGIFPLFKFFLVWCAQYMTEFPTALSGCCFVGMQYPLEMFANEEDLENASLYEPLGYVGVVFRDNMSYRLRFPYNQLPLPSDYTESIGEGKLLSMVPQFLDKFHIFSTIVMFAWGSGTGLAFLLWPHNKHIRDTYLCVQYMLDYKINGW